MKIGKGGAAVLTAVLIFSTISMDSQGAVLTYTPKKSSTVSYREEIDENEKYGPGYVSETEAYLDEEEETTEFSGPGVNKVSLSERYHEDYKIYEESIADMFFLYSNVSNGGMTDEAVSIDIPANVLYTMEKDGVKIDYTSGQQVSARGTYVLRLTAVENPELPLSEQTEYQAVFRFRIQDKPPMEETEDVLASVSDIGGKVNLKGYEESLIPELTETPKETEVIPEETEAEPETEADSKEDETKEAQEENPEVWNPEEASEADPKENISMKRSQSYDLAQGRYVTAFSNGIELLSTVPDGYIGPSSVRLAVKEEEQALVQLYKDDELIEFMNDSSISDSGSYRLSSGGEIFSFMIASDISELSYYPAPSGMRFTAIYLGTEQQKLESERQLTLKEDGAYTIFMEGEAGEELEVRLTKDTEKPEVYVTIKGGNAGIQYVSADIEKIQLEKNGELVEEFRGTAITKPGNYRLTVTDRAGNENVQEFALKYQVNGYGIAAVALCIALIIGLVMFVMHTKKNMKIR